MIDKKSQLPLTSHLAFFPPLLHRWLGEKKEKEAQPRREGMVQCEPQRTRGKKTLSDMNAWKKVVNGKLYY